MAGLHAQRPVLDLSNGNKAFKTTVPSLEITNLQNTLYRVNESIDKIKIRPTAMKSYNEITFVFFKREHAKNNEHIYLLKRQY